MRTDRDLAAAVAAVAVVVGIDRAVASACRVLDTETMQAVLTRLQRSTLDPETERLARSQKGFLKSLREALAVRSRGRGAQARRSQADQLAQPVDGRRAASSACG